MRRGAGRPRPCSRRSAGASARATARSSSQASTSAASVTAPRATRSRGSSARRRRLPGSSACGSRRSRSTTSTTELVAALPETPTVSPHLHVPLQSGDDGVLARDGPPVHGVAVRAALAPLAGLNLTTDVIVGFPAEDEAAFERTLALVERLGMTKVHVFPYSPRPGTRTADDDRVAPAGQARAGRTAARALGRALPPPLAGAGRERPTGCSSTGPGRGYADDYTPWLVDGAVGALRRRARAVASRRRGCSPLPPEPTASSAGSSGRRPRPRRGRLRRDPRHRAEGADAPARPARAPRRHVPGGRRASRTRRRSACSSFVAETARDARASRTTA